MNKGNNKITELRTILHQIKISTSGLDVNSAEFNLSQMIIVSLIVNYI
jgi:hypothetical protein